MIFTFPIQVSYQDFLNYYQGSIDKIEVRDISGKILWIHARHFRPFLTTSGIKGYFRLELDDNGQFVSLTPL
ncbi:MULTISPECIES: DUF2835 domain-containing protein [Shewanella]|uniref:DUF2835 family protein n=1 Tax=Shewanella marisflavi TaxID=260364 RepID=A0AAC9U049_9GAMM|nr:MULTISPECIES: DUF2835 domain-containing protein [Shewanella]ASJ96948.1 hypothetical protein CFF01_10375 [Shewanella marisflavi]MCL1042508.1 DUF2835 domain-containing protein [Shewanella marisflavi]QDF77237.1 DUF2835 family protein [Shewanella marisflavi]